jgi:hypothetical protein
MRFAAQPQPEFLERRRIEAAAQLAARNRPSSRLPTPATRAIRQVPRATETGAEPLSRQKTDGVSLSLEEAVPAGKASEARSRLVSRSRGKRTQLSPLPLSTDPLAPRAHAPVFGRVYNAWDASTAAVAFKSGFPVKPSFAEPEPLPAARVRAHFNVSLLRLPYEMLLHLLPPAHAPALARPGLSSDPTTKAITSAAKTR